MDRNKTVNKVSFFVVMGNILLTVFKFLAGFFGNSSAMVSDAVHSLADVIATFIAWMGVKLSLRKNGYEKVEYIASLILGLILLTTAVCIGISGIKAIISGEKSSPDIIALIMAAVSILVKEIMYRYIVYYAKILNSCAFMAEAWHQRGDALASTGVLIGIIGAILGFSIFEPIASIMISLCILKISYSIIKDSIIKISEASYKSLKIKKEI